MNVMNCTFCFNTKLRTWNVFSANDYRGGFSFFLCLFKGNNKVMYTGRYETS